MPSLVKTQLFCARSKIGGRGVYFREDRTFRGFIEHGTGTMEVEIVSSQEEFPKRIFSLDEFLKRPSNLTEKHPQIDGNLISGCVFYLINPSAKRFFCCLRMDLLPQIIFVQAVTPPPHHFRILKHRADFEIPSHHLRTNFF